VPTELGRLDERSLPDAAARTAGLHLFGHVARPVLPIRDRVSIGDKPTVDEPGRAIPGFEAGVSGCFRF
jgi:hypothetical protein